METVSTLPNVRSYTYVTLNGFGVISDPQLLQEGADTEWDVLHEDLADARPGDGADAFLLDPDTLFEDWDWLLVGLDFPITMVQCSDQMQLLDSLSVKSIANVYLQPGYRHDHSASEAALKKLDSRSKMYKTDADSGWVGPVAAVYNRAVFTLLVAE